MHAGRATRPIGPVTQVDRNISDICSCTSVLDKVQEVRNILVRRGVQAKESESSCTGSVCVGPGSEAPLPTYGNDGSADLSTQRQLRSRTHVLLECAHSSQKSKSPRDPLAATVPRGIRHRSSSNAKLQIHSKVVARHLSRSQTPPLLSRFPGVQALGSRWNVGAPEAVGAMKTRDTTSEGIAQRSSSQPSASLPPVPKARSASLIALLLASQRA